MDHQTWLPKQRPVEVISQVLAPLINHPIWKGPTQVCPEANNNEIVVTQVKQLMTPYSWHSTNQGPIQRRQWEAPWPCHGRTMLTHGFWMDCWLRPHWNSHLFCGTHSSQAGSFNQSISSATKHLIREKQVACYIDRLEMFKDNKKVLYNTLWQLCSKLPKTKLMGHPEFKKEQKWQNPIWILQAITSTIYQFNDTKPLSLALDEEMEAMMCFCQPEHTDNAD